MPNSPRSPMSSSQSSREQRTVPRYSFIATVDIIEPISDVRISG